MEHSEGEVIHGYKILSIIGKGGMADVYKVYNHAVKRLDAMKILRNPINSDIERFEREIETLSRLRHPNIAIFREAFRNDDGELFMVMEFIEGSNLANLKKPMHVDQCLGYVRQVLEALSHAHVQDVIHRDIKLENVMLTDAGTIKLTDFGIAKVLAAPTLTITGQVFGTPAYMSPEQIRGKRLDARSDIYSLGVMVYEMVTGQRPFRGDEQAVMYQHVYEFARPPEEINPNLPLEVSKLIMTALSKDPARRFPTAGLFRKAIDQYLLKVQPEPVSSVQSAAIESHRSGLGVPADSRSATAGMAGEVEEDLITVRSHAADRSGTSMVSPQPVEPPGVGQPPGLKIRVPIQWTPWPRYALVASAVFLAVAAAIIEFPTLDRRGEAGNTSSQPAVPFPAERTKSKRPVRPTVLPRGGVLEPDTQFTRPNELGAKKSQTQGNRVSKEAPAQEGLTDRAGSPNSRRDSDFAYHGFADDQSRQRGLTRLVNPPGPEARQGRAGVPNTGSLVVRREIVPPSEGVSVPKTAASREVEGRIHYPSTELGQNTVVPLDTKRIKDTTAPRQPLQQINVPDAYTEHWFDPLHWYVRDRNGPPRFFVGAQKGDQDPITGTLITPITNGIVYEVQQRQNEAKRLQEFRNGLAGRRQKARDAQKALDSANYELALENCSGVAAEFRPDPCEDIYREAASRMASTLVNRSKLEIQEDKLEDAIRDAQLALRIDPRSQEANRVLALAQSLERAEGGPKQ